MKEVKRINEPDVAIYTVIINDGCNGASGGVGTACDNEEFKKVAIARGPTLGIIETAEVGMVISLSILSSCLIVKDISFMIYSTSNNCSNPYLDISP